VAIPGRLIGMNIKDVSQAIRGNLACAVVMSVIVFAGGKALPPSLPSSITLFLQVALGTITYAGLTHFSRQGALKEIAEIRLHATTRRADGAGRHDGTPEPLEHLG